MEGELEWCTKTAHIVGKRDRNWINSFQPFASRNDTVIFPSSPGCHIVTLVEIWVVWKHHFAHPKSIEWLQDTVSGQYNRHNAKRLLSKLRHMKTISISERSCKVLRLCGSMKLGWCSPRKPPHSETESEKDNLQDRERERQPAQARRVECMSYDCLSCGCACRDLEIDTDFSQLHLGYPPEAPIWV